ncbi:hypothetical protein C8F04DRAFT_1140301 [Mycena alexandri]|uniref:Uncharacterized protein n=1 Tax=Mycena alexandri TaxID=1745969 RepID=A0AAD6S9J5_9AGAR|nr:hypothetical protein C8F04DRAFT_1140301 [Mycena alexandri]
MNRQPPPMQSPPRPAYPQQAYNPGPTRQSPPSQPQTTTSPTQPVLNSQRDPRLDQSQLPYTLQRRPELPRVLTSSHSCKGSPSRPDQQPQLQRQPSRPDQPPQLQYNNPMAAADNNYVYKEVPVNPAASDPIRPSQYSQSTMFPRPYDSGMVIRGNSDDELDKSDKSSWLEKTEGKSSRHSRTLWIVGLLAAGGIGIGIFFSFHNTSNTTRPNTLGGAENVAGAQAATIALGATAAAAGTDAGQTASGTALHVTPTNTVA